MFRSRSVLLALLFLLLGAVIEARPPGLPVHVVEVVGPLEAPTTPVVTVDMHTTDPPQCPEVLKIIFLVFMVLFIVGVMCVAAFSRFFQQREGRGARLQMTNLPPCPQYSYSY